MNRLHHVRFVASSSFSIIIALLSRKDNLCYSAKYEHLTGGHIQVSDVMLISEFLFFANFDLGHSRDTLEHPNDA